MRANNNFTKVIATSALTALLAACGGGSTGGSLLGGGTGGGMGGSGGSGGGSGTGEHVEIVTNPNLTQQDPNSFITAEYARNTNGGSTGLAQINAAAAYGMGTTGSGITIGLIDTGIDTSNVEFAGAISADSINIVNGSKTDLDGSNPHGTWVAGVVGARKNGTYTHGVAFDSDLLVIRTETTSTSCPTGCFSGTDLANAVNYATAHDARVINMSLGAQGYLGAALSSAMVNAAAHDVLMVAAAGNGGFASPDAPANLGSVSGIAGNLLAVGAVDSNNQITSWSNRAGSSANWYLVAPGSNLLTTDTGGMALVAGTSFSAPMVSGAAALVMQYAPYLTAKQVATILLDSATDLGAPGVDLIYGHGLLNVGAALQPAGTSSVPSGVNAQDGQGAAVDATTLSLGAAFGNALSNNNLLHRGIMVDSYGRAYGFDMANRVQATGYTSNLKDFVDAENHTTTGGMALGLSTSLVSSFTEHDTSHMVKDLAEQDRLADGDTRMALSSDISDDVNLTYTHGFGIGQAFGLTAENNDVANDIIEKSAFGNAYLNLVEGGNTALGNFKLANGLSMTVASGAETGRTTFTSDTKNSADRSAYAASLNYDAGGAMLGLNAGTVSESSSTLGSQSNGALAFGAGSTTSFVGATASINLGKGLTLAGSYTFGVTNIKDAANSLIGDFRGVQSDSFAVALTADDVAQKNDRLTLAVSQPVRVSSGSASLTVPTGVNNDGGVRYETQRVGLTPTGRQLDIQAGYAFALNDKETLALSTVGTLNPGDNANAAAALTVGVRYNRKF